MTGDVLLTGATGLIGGEIARRLMSTGVRVWCLVRGSDYSEAASRLERRLSVSASYCDWTHLVALPGDVTQPGLGLDDSTLRYLRKSCRQVIHCAADTSFAARNQCADVNTGGTRQVLDLCRLLGRHMRLLHVSSAAVCLRSSKELIHEDDCPRGHCNDYVSSKRACEHLVLHSDVTSVVLRPSIVLSEGLGSREFARAMLWVFPVMRRLGVVPMTGMERLDAVSVGFVSECIARMAGRPLAHQIYHLSAGRRGAVTLMELFESFNRRGLGYEDVRLNGPDGWDMGADGNLGRVRLARLLELYLPFLRAGAVYDRSRLEVELAGDIPDSPKSTAYCADLLKLFTEQEACAEALNP